MHQINIRTKSSKGQHFWLRLALLPSGCFFSFRFVWVTALFDCALDTDYKRKGKSNLYRPATINEKSGPYFVFRCCFKMFVANSLYTKAQ